MTARLAPGPFLLAATLLGTLLLGAGCRHNVYELELTPEQESLDRQLTCWSEPRTEGGRTQALPADELRRLAQEYAAPLDPTAQDKHHFQRKFTGRLPNDVGGAGYYLYWPSGLGETFVYLEEFRGTGLLAAEFRRRQEGVDRLVEHLLAWLKAEYAHEPEFDRLAVLIDREVRADLHDAAAWVWAYGVTSPDKALSAEQLAARLQLFLAQRGYVAPAELPAWRRALDEAQHGASQRLLERLQRLVASKLGHPADEAIPAGLAWLADERRLQASCEKYLASTPEYARLLAAWEEERKAKPDARRPHPHDVLAELLLAGLVPDLRIAPDDALRIRLHAGQRPFATNGAWNSDSGEVTWNAELPPRGFDRRQAPRLMYAAWAMPNRAAQVRHFGRVMLEGKALADYCLWVRGLTPDEAAAWETFVATLAADDDPFAKVQAFRFEAADPHVAAALQETPRRLLAPGPQNR